MVRSNTTLQKLSKIIFPAMDMFLQQNMIQTLFNEVVV